MKIVDLERSISTRRRLWCCTCLLSVLLCFLACAKRAIVTHVLDSAPSTIMLPPASEVRASRFYEWFALDFDATWSRTIEVLVPSALIIKVREGEGLIYIVEIDGFYHRDKLHFAEFPMVLGLTESGGDSTAVRILPVGKGTFLPDDDELKEPYSQAQDQRAIELLDRLGAELTGKTRWPWLWEESDGE